MTLHQQSTFPISGYLLSWEFLYLIIRSFYHTNIKHKRNNYKYITKALLLQLNENYNTWQKSHNNILLFFALGYFAIWLLPHSYNWHSTLSNIVERKLYRMCMYISMYLRSSPFYWNFPSWCNVVVLINEITRHSKISNLYNTEQREATWFT